jgi:hypothetical protein
MARSIYLGSSRGMSGSFLTISYSACSPFSLSIPFKYCIQLLRRERRFIRKGEDITGIVHKLGISMQEYA